ncbi:LysE/ArgO family amino acid transporter [Dictyobacter arantiisoli]|uniref:Amino acid transporter n=1 Tax=Dictyobacter arantiisoli TaxID=2014874 RepID=A0A5A5T6J7_9CHLR|nr:LysE/ArgO family amino acid transporter [Dictyobacter arantiisoli]GCF07012.1 amino acid transporter [Dictyobacter arantiisoli]
MIQALVLALFQGLGLGASLIVAIGAQNSFVLRQGIKKHHVFVVASLCTLCDAVLISLGIGGLGVIISAFPPLTIIATWSGALFLLVYGFRAFRAALAPETLEGNATSAQPVRLRDTVLTVLAFSLLNPHVYLDTVVLIGSVGTHYHSLDRLFFAIGAMLASLIWFFSLAYGARWLAPLFRHPLAWKVLDGMIGCIMWIIAASLIRVGTGH